MIKTITSKQAKTLFSNYHSPLSFFTSNIKIHNLNASYSIIAIYKEILYEKTIINFYCI